MNASDHFKCCIHLVLGHLFSHQLYYQLCPLTSCYAITVYTLSLSPPVNCSDPTVPRNGSIEPYQNTTGGAVIFFRCNPGFVPAERMRTLCRADGRWNPDPATLVCTCELKMMSEWISMDGILIILFSELWNSLFCWSCGCRAIKQYHSGFRDCLPVSVRASTRREDDLSVQGRWEVEP